MDWMSEADKPTVSTPHPGFAMRATYDPDATGPVMFLDFDGVLNAVTRTGNKTDRNVWSDYTYLDMPSTIGDVDSYPVNYSPSVVSFLHEMVDAGVELVWLTTWCEDTVFFNAMLGTPEAKWLGVSGSAAQDANLFQDKSWWKLEEARTYAAMRPVIWVDDDHYSNSRKVNEWVSSRSRYAATLIVSPQTRLGLTKKMLRNIREFVEEQNNRKVI